MENVLNLLGHDLRYNNIVEGSNCTLIDSNRNTYLDLESGIWCTSIGHSNPFVTQTISENSGKLMHAGYCYNSSIVNIAAKKVLDITGHKNGKCVFLCSGSEAVDLSITISMNVTKKNKILALSDSYLSAFGHFVNTNEIVKHNWLNNENIDAIPYDEISAFVFEPGSSSGLVRFPPKELIALIIKNIKDAGGIIIANEVTTGIGRTGAWFGYNHYSIFPDIIAIGKGLGNGYPVSCVSFSNETVDRIDLTHFHYGQSHQNDPLGASVALCVLNTIENMSLIERVDEIGKYIEGYLTEIKREYGCIKEIRSRGLMFAVEFLPVPNRSIAKEVTEKLLQNHIIVAKRPNSEVIRFDPALTIEKEDVDYFLESFKYIIKEIRLTTAST